MPRLRPTAAAMSYSTSTGFTPISSPWDFRPWARAALSSIALAGMQPQFRQVPPRPPS